MKLKSMTSKPTAIVIISLLALLVLVARVSTEKQAPLMHEKLVAYFPFVFGDSVDPTQIFTVGQQVVAEHVFACTARRSIEDGFTDHVGNVAIDISRSEFAVSLKHELKSADGKFFTAEDLCNSVSLSVSGTTHAPYKSLLVNIDCQLRAVAVKYRSLPANLRFLFTLPDFAIFRKGELPLTEAKSGSSTGPYFPVSMSNDRIILKRNTHYPSALVANNIENAELISYSAGDTANLIEKLDSQATTAAYFFGHSLVKSDIEALEKKDFEVELSPHEWLLYLKVSDGISEAVRDSISLLIAELEHKTNQTGLGITTSSMIISDRMSKSAKPSTSADLRALEGQTVYTLDTWSQTPAFRELTSYLIDRVPTLKMVTIGRDRIADLYTDKCPIAIGLLGLSPVDRLSHLAFLANSLEGFSSIISADEIVQASVADSEMEFETLLAKFDERLKKSKFLFPLMSYPGVTAFSKNIKVDRSLSFDWGIQLWSIQKR